MDLLIGDHGFGGFQHRDKSDFAQLNVQPTEATNDRAQVFSGKTRQKLI